jgi:hypothetical protein
MPRSPWILKGFYVAIATGGGSGFVAAAWRSMTASRALVSSYRRRLPGALVVTHALVAIVHSALFAARCCTPVVEPATTAGAPRDSTARAADLH